jgi:type I restriction enzyme S subunit
VSYETEELRGVIRVEKGRPPLEQPYDGPDADFYLTPNFLRGRASAERVRPGPSAVRAVDGDTVILWDGSNAGEVLRGRNGIVASTMVRVVSPPRYDRDYFFYALKSAEAYLKGQTAGSGIPHVDRELLGKVRIRKLPHNEQERVAALLTMVDKALEQTRRLIIKEDRIRAGLLVDLLTRGVDARGQLRNRDANEFVDSPVGRIPADWKVEPLGALAQVSSGVTLGGKHVGPGTVELPYLRVANVQDGYLELREIKLIRVPASGVERHMLRAGDVLMNEGGDFDKLGRGTVWRGEIDPCLHQNHVFKVRPRPKVLSPDFLAAVSASTYGKAFFVLASKQSTNLASINATQLRAFPIPYPEYDEQLRIVDVLRQQSEHRQLLRAQESKLVGIREGLLADLLAVSAEAAGT